MKGFASDNNSGVHPVIMQSVLSANSLHTLSYGGDPYTLQAEELLKKEFGRKSEIFFVFNGTAANCTALSAVARPYNAIICAQTAHINTDECGAPEKISGCKLLPVPSENGKINVGDLEKFVGFYNNQHHSQPKIISISQTTELGTVYTINEIKTIADFAHSNGMLLHIDGARLSNAAAALACSLADITVNAGADLLSFGGTKNGLMFGEAVVFFKPELAQDFLYIRKQNMQLASKMRYISAQFSAYLANEQWRKTASHANKMAKLLANELGKLNEIKISQSVDANGVFAIIPQNIIPKLQEKYFFYVWNEDKSEVRLMTSWDTSESDVNDFIDLLKHLLITVK